MWLALNELSFHGQFTSAGEVYDTIERLMSLRALARRGGQTIRLPRDLFDRHAIGARPLKEVLRVWPDRNKRAALLSWADREGPFALDDRQHTGEEFLVLEVAPDDPITDTALAEAAWRKLKTGDAEVVSASPSDLTHSPLRLLWRPDDVAREPIELDNHTTPDTLSTSLERDFAVTSWATLERWAIYACPNLTFSKESFEGLKGETYKQACADAIKERLTVLERIKGSCLPGASGGMTAAGQALVENYFWSKSAWFVNASPTEANSPLYREQMTFKHPTNPGERVFVPWHGRIYTGVLRIHFSYPINHADPLIIFYVGPKLTKR